MQWGSLEGGVVGGVIGSPALALDCKLPESSVNAPDPESPLALETCPKVRWPTLPMEVIALKEKFERLGGEPTDTGDPRSLEDWGDCRLLFDRPRLAVCSSKLEFDTTVISSS